MRQSIEKQQETKLTGASVTVMFHGSQFVLGRVGSTRAREKAVASVSEWLAGFPGFASGAASQSTSLAVAQQARTLRDRTRCRSLSQTEKFSAEGLIVCSALAVLTVSPIMRSSEAVATVITTMTEQRRCAAA